MTTSQTPRPALCPNCGVAGTGQFCSACGAEYADGKANPYVFLADSFFEFGNMKSYVLFLKRLLSSPTKHTIEAFEAGRLIDGVRFVKYGVGLYALALAVSGFDKLFSNNELVKTIGQSVQYFVMYVVTYTLYYRAMRRKGTKQRTIREFMLFGCLTTGLAIPISMVMLLPLPRLVAGLLELAIGVWTCVYLTRTWKYFWGASGKRVFCTWMGCTFVGVLAGFAVEAAAWAIFGLPDFTSFLGRVTPT